MSTRSLIGGDTDRGTIMVYVHSDGYPDGHWGKIETLRRLIAAHGIDRVMATLLQTTSGWSSFDGDTDDGLSKAYDDGRFELVPGFGVRYTLTEMEPRWPGGQPYVQGNTSYATPADFTGDADNWWDVAYIYVVSADGKQVRYCENDSRQAWDDKPWQTVSLLLPAE